MKAIFFQPHGQPTQADAAILKSVPTPEPEGRDVLVRIEAVSVNPVDTKVRPKAGEEEAILGYDAAGTVVAVGDGVETLNPGDPVYYAGDIRRPGSNAEFQLVDERIAARRPATLGAVEAAALPLTTLTAWEALFDRLRLDPDGTDARSTLLVIGGAGGVGSIAIQLAKLAGLTVIATASRSKSAEWCLGLGADHVVDHRDALRPQLEQLGFDHVDAIANFNNTDAYWEAMGDIIAPQGRIVLIVESSVPLDLNCGFKSKSVSIHWEFMFTRSMYGTDDMIRQKRILEQAAALVDSGKLRGTLTSTLGAMSPDTLREAHSLLESGRTIGKIGLSALA